MDLFTSGTEKLAIERFVSERRLLTSFKAPDHDECVMKWQYIAVEIACAPSKCVAFASDENPLSWSGKDLNEMRNKPQGRFERSNITIKT